MRYAGIDKCELCNGNDIGVSLYVQGCDTHCTGCFNPETWSFDGGFLWTNTVADDFFSMIDKPYIKRVSFLGGEPLDRNNIRVVASLILYINNNFPDKKVWLYTGCIFEKLLETVNLTDDSYSLYLYSILHMIDYIVEGPFELDKRDTTLAFRGSSNQRIIDMQKSFREKKICLYEEEEGE